MQKYSSLIDILPRFISFVLVLFFVNQPQANTVRSSHPVNEFIRQKTIQLNIHVAGKYTLPYHHQQVQNILGQIARQTKLLTQRDQKRLELFQQEFLNTKTLNPYPLSYKKDSKSIYSEFQYSHLYTLNDSSGNQKSSIWDRLSLQIKGDLSQQLSYVSEGSVIRLITNEDRYRDNYDPSRGLPYNTPESRLGTSDYYSNASFDSYRTVFSWKPDIYRIEFGKDHNTWGPGVTQHASVGHQGYFWLQDIQEGDHLESPEESHVKTYRYGYRDPNESAPMPQFRVRMDWNNLSYTQFAAQSQGLSHQPQTMTYGHRLESRFGAWTMGLHEVMVSGRDDTDWVYFLPLVPFFVAEHHTGDRDNVTLGLDLNYQLTRLGRIYTELFLDDLLSPGALLDNYWGNKYAWTMGSEWVNLWPGMTYSLEYTRVEPWMYSHHTKNGQLQHYGALLGSIIPPNSDQVDTKLRQDLGFQWSLELAYTHRRHQAKARGSSILHIHNQVYPDATWVDSQQKEFLGANPERWSRIAGDLEWQNWRWCWLEVGTFYESTQNLNSEKGKDSREYGLWTQFRITY